MKKLKVYGTAKRGHRENWKGKYMEVRRDKHGRFLSTKKWSPKRPIGKPKYEEFEVPATKKAVVEKYKAHEWVKMEVKS